MFFSAQTLERILPRPLHPHITHLPEIHFVAWVGKRIQMLMGEEEESFASFVMQQVCWEGMQGVTAPFFTES